MAQQSSARIFDFAVYRMQRIARERRASGATRRFLWGHPAAMQAVEFPARQQASPFSAQAR